jgi:hypothetical protein
MDSFTRKSMTRYIPSGSVQATIETNSSSSDYESTSESSESTSIPTLQGTQYDFSMTSKMRGMWFKIILDGVGADEGDKYEKIVYLRQFRRLQEHFPCSMCKQHFGEYIRLYPPEQVVTLKDGFFNYVVEFMNSINRGLGKPEYDRDILYDMFHKVTSNLPCKDCGVSRSQPILIRR